MTLESDDELEEPEWTPRPVVTPTFKIPARLAGPVAWGVLVAATLAVVAALVTAVSFRQPAPANLGLPGPGLNLSEPSFGLADRIYLFDRGAASLTVSLLVLVAVVVAAMAAPPDGEGRPPLQRGLVLLESTAVIGLIVVLANVAQAIVILSNASGELIGSDSANKTSSVLALIPPTLTAAAALVYVVTRLRVARDQLPPVGR